VIGVDFATTDLPAGGGEISHLHGLPVRDCARGAIDDSAVRAIGLVRAEPDGEEFPHPANELQSRGRERGRSFAQRGVEGCVDVRALQGPEQVAAEDQRHQLRRREAERREPAKAIEQLPSRLAVDALGHHREAGALQRGQVPPHGAEMLGEIIGQSISDLSQRQARRAFKTPQQVPLPGHLVVSRHGCPILPRKAR
jgi:hypothetical protein